MFISEGGYLSVGGGGAGGSSRRCRRYSSTINVIGLQ